MNKVNPLIAAALCATALTTPAIAQDNAQEAATFDDNVIVVTATRRSQDVQDIPLAVTAISPVELDRQGVVNVGQITNLSSSYSVSNAQLASGSVVLRIRGVGTTSNNIGFESAVGIFIDGAYQSRPGVALSELVDVERVEVLRGPQGTLFGRNTSAGALNIINIRPDLNTFGGFANATYGNRDLTGVQGAVNLPIVEGELALRVTGAYRERDGYVTVVDGSSSKIGDSNGIDQYLVRSQLGFETGGGIRGRLIADYSKSTAGCCAAIEVLQSPLESAGLFAAVGLGPRGGMAGPVVAVNPFDTSTAEIAAGNLIATASFAPETRFDQWGVTGEVEVPLGDSANLIYIGSYREYDATEAYDNDFSDLDLFNVTGNRTAIDTMTHEIRVQGDLFGGALNWLVGGYYSREDIAQDLSLALGEDYDQVVGATLAGATGGATLNPLSPIFLGTTPLQNITGFDPATITNTNLYAQNSESWSIFTHNVLEVADGLKLTLGLRYSDESKVGSFASGGTSNSVCPSIVGQLSPGGPLSGLPASLQNALFALGCFALTAPADAPFAAVLPTPRTFSSKFSDSELIYTGTLSYAFADPVNIYASFTHGYKSGGINLDSTATAGGADPRFQSEEVDSYEIGLKAKFLDNAVTLNLAAFREEFSNFQILEYTGTQFRPFNVPKAVSQGVEIETTLRPSDHFTVNAALTFTDAHYPDDCAGTQTTVNVLALCGNSLTNAPDFVGIAGATYSNDIGASLEYFLNGQVRFEGDRRTSTQAVDPTDLTALPFVVQDSNIKINLRAGIGSQDKAWGIETFVTNLTNEVTRGVTFATILRSGSQSVFVQDPRSYGLTLRSKF
ncbi:TonB-dependent receptor [Sphingorhabdus sp. M41]|uniref:TonB-dependent receptor n=1 Tax=Sphingorhabdus sp. M41 TaxID=1806885 RepID=UPI00078C0D79|nr:TonB-dependent receptor [Sphingorhabdus sp. M41]AMO71081.1 TonB-dependent receptor [Sphingorhabdus sp. M41]